MRMQYDFVIYIYIPAWINLSQGRGEPFSTSIWYIQCDKYRPYIYIYIYLYNVHTNKALSKSLECNSSSLAIRVPGSLNASFVNSHLNHINCDHPPLPPLTVASCHLVIYSNDSLWHGDLSSAAHGALGEVVKPRGRILCAALRSSW